MSTGRSDAQTPSMAQDIRKGRRTETDFINGLGAALSYLVAVRCAGARVPMALLNLGLGLLFIAYTPELGWLWGLCLGLVWGWIWQRLPRPLPRKRLTYGLALGFVLSYALHANLQLPGLRHLLWLGN